MRKYLFSIVTCLLLFSNVFSQEVIIGKETIPDWFPMFGNNYEYSQTIYKQQWVHAQGEINKIAYYYASGTSTESIQADIYMGHTSEKELGINKWIPTNELSLVYSGSIDLLGSNLWIEIILDTPFEYNNSDNLVVAIDINSTSSIDGFIECSQIDEDVSSMVFGDAEYNFDPANLPVSWGNWLGNKIPRIKIAGDLTILPYMYVLGNRENNITTDPDSSIVIAIENNVASYTASSDQEWLEVSWDVGNNTLTGTINSINSTLNEEIRTATVVVSANGVNNDTIWFNQHQFEPKLFKAELYSFVDYDNDGDMDISEGLSIHKNNGDNTYSVVQIIADSLNNGQTFWQDYNNDGLMDFLIFGNHWESGTYPTRIYRNNGNGNFTNIQAEIEALIPYHTGVYRKTSWCDYNNDGLSDCLISGRDTSGKHNIKLYKNLGDDQFVESGIDLYNCSDADIDWGDYNNDGLKDLILTGEDIDGNANAILYKNEGNDNFTKVNSQFLPLIKGSVEWGDYDSDGDLDLLFSGQNRFGYNSKIFRNEGNDSFTEINLGFPWLRSSDCRWIDFDNDGDLDIVLLGTIETGEAYVMKYRNNGDDTFPIESQILLNMVSEGAAPFIKIIDYDNDGDMDFMIPSSRQGYTSIYRNNTNIENTTPSTPISVHAEKRGDDIVLSWKPANDDKTPSKSLSYNVRIGTSNGLADILSPQADMNTGYLKIQGNETTSLDTFKIISDLPLGKYYWSVQSVDKVFGSSAFSEEDSFSVIPGFSVFESGIDKGTSSGKWGDYDNDGDLDLIRQGQLSIYDSPENKLFKNLGDTTFVDINAGFFGLGNGAAVWGDYDNDNDLDLLITGWPSHSSGFMAKIYRNDGDDIFTDLLLNFESIGNPCSDWADYDNDGKLDLVISGVLYHNDGNDSFTPQYYPEMEFTRNANAFADFDNDSDMDLLCLSGGQGSSLYLNNDGEFSEINTDFLQLQNGIIDWGDYDNDGLLDILITGVDSIGNSYTQVNRNAGDGRFIEINTDMRSVYEGEADWADFNNDGLLDIVIAGNSSDPIFIVYENLGNNTFMPVFNCDTLIDESLSVVTWGDYNNDNNLDIFLGNGTIYSNNYNIHKDSIGAPLNLDAVTIEFDVKFSWDRLKSLQNPEEVYSYNLRVGTSPGGTDILSPMSDVTSGYRKLPSIGNAQLNTNWTIKKLSAGQTYYWSVQAIDNSFTGGPWAEEQSVTLLNVYADFAADTVCQGIETSFIDNTISPSEDITNWLWDFGDGNTSSDQHPTHIYAASDTFNVKLVVSSAQYKDSLSQQVIVKPKPDANFLMEAVCLGDPSVIFNITDENDLSISSWKWKFGDSQTFDLKNPVEHYFAKSGTYNTKLLVAADNGCSDSITKDAIVGAVPVATVSAGVNTVFCSGEKNVLSGIYLENYKYQWRVGNINISGADSSIYAASSSGDFSLQVTNPIANCISNSDPIELTVKSSPTAPAISVTGDTVFCIGDSVLLSVFNNPEYSYDWLLNNGGTGIGDNMMYAKISGEYNISVTNSNNCVVTSNTPIEILVHPKPNLPLISAVDYVNNKCDNESPVELIIDNPEADVNYSWKFNGTDLSVYGEQYSEYLEEGYYSVDAEKNECKIESAEFLIDYGDVPEKPDIIAEGPNVWYLACSHDSAAIYKWYLDGAIIEGATNYMYVAGQDFGKYEVSISEGDCFAKSNPVWIPLGTGIETDPWAGLKIYPNPTPGLFTLEMDNPIMGELIIDIFGENGKQIINIKFLKEMNHFQTQIDLSGQPAAVYIIGLMLEEYRASRRLVVE